MCRSLSIVPKKRTRPGSAHVMQMAKKWNKKSQNENMFACGSSMALLGCFVTIFTERIVLTLEPHFFQCHVHFPDMFLNQLFGCITRRFNRLPCWITTWCHGDLQTHGEGQINGRCCVQGSVMKEHRWRCFPHHKHGLQRMKIQCWWLEMCFLSWITSDFTGSFFWVKHWDQEEKNDWG